jgi:hypothetical protein
MASNPPFPNKFEKHALAGNVQPFRPRELLRVAVFVQGKCGHYLDNQNQRLLASVVGRSGMVLRYRCITIHVEFIGVGRLSGRTSGIDNVKESPKLADRNPGATLPRLPSNFPLVVRNIDVDPAAHILE